MVDKPLAATSHDVVAAARRALGTRRVGHAGTLDPLATGVLLLLVEGATKLSPFLTGGDKEYLAWVAFGAGTPTLDAEGPIDARGDAGALSPARIAEALPPFLHLTEQRPPAFSAVRREGVRSYDRARRGEEVTLPPRPAGYARLELLAFGSDRDALPARFRPGADGTWTPHEDGRSFPLPPPLAPLPTALLSVRVRAGTYLRSLARDLGAALGVPAHLSGLVRTRSGGIGLERAVPLDALRDAAPIRAVDALPYPRTTLDDEQVARVRQGQRPSLTGSGRRALVAGDGALVAVAEVIDGRTSLLRVWPAGDAA